MIRQGLFCFLMLAAVAATAQKKAGLDKKLDIFWKSKKLTAQGDCPRSDLPSR